MLWRGPMGGGAASGAIGAMIAGHCAQGQYLKSRVKSVNPRSIQQHALRNALRQLAPTWLTQLTPTQRAAWATYAANTTWVNRLGDTVHLSGQMEFCRSNWPRHQAGMTLINDAPVIFDRGLIGDSPTLTLGIAESQFTITLNPAAPWIDGDPNTALIVYLGIPRPSSLSFLPKRARLIDIIPSTAATGIQVLVNNAWPLPDYQQQWPAWIVLATADGRLSTPQPLDPFIFGPPPPPSWIEDFTYPDGTLQTSGDWTAGDFTPADAPITSNTLILGTSPPDGGQNPMAILHTVDWSQPWTFTVELQIDNINDDTFRTDFAVGDFAGTYTQLVLNWTIGDIGLDNLTSLVINQIGGNTGTASNTPFTTGVPHTIIWHYDGTDLTVTIDAVLILTVTTAIGNTSQNFNVYNGISDGPDQMTIFSLRFDPF